MKIYQNQSLNYFANKQKNEEEEESSDQMKIRLFFLVESVLLMQGQWNRPFIHSFIHLTHESFIVIIIIIIIIIKLFSL